MECVAPPRGLTGYDCTEPRNNPEGIFVGKTMSSALNILNIFSYITNHGERVRHGRHAWAHWIQVVEFITKLTEIQAYDSIGASRRECIHRIADRKGIAYYEYIDRDSVTEMIARCAATDGMDRLWRPDRFAFRPNQVGRIGRVTHRRPGMRTRSPERGVEPTQARSRMERAPMLAAPRLVANIHPCGVRVAARGATNGTPDSAPVKTAFRPRPCRGPSGWPSDSRSPSSTTTS